MKHRCFLKKKSVLLILTLALCVPMLFAGIATATETVRIGMLLPLSGGSAAIGNQTKTGAEVAVAQINAAGGIKALGGAKIELVFADTQSKPDVGVSEAERLIQVEKVDLIIGAYNSAVTFPSSEVAERYGVPWLVSGSVKNEITERGFKYVFRPNNKATYDAREQMDAIELLKKETGHGPKKLGLLYRGDDWGRSHANTLKEMATKLGYEISLDESYVPGQVDFSAQILKLRSTKTEALILVAGTADHILFNKQMFGNRVDLPYGLHSVGGGAEDPSFYSAVPQAAYEYMFTQEDWQIDRMKADVSDVIVAANKKFKEALGYEMNSYGSQGFSNIYITVDVLERAASKDKTKIRDAFAATEITSGPALITGFQKVIFDENGQNPHAHGVISQNIAGERLTIWPSENRLETTKPVWPVPKWSER